MNATIEGKKVSFPSARISSGANSYELVLMSVPGDCSPVLPHGSFNLELQLPEGPGGNHFAPGPTETSTIIRSNDKLFEAEGAHWLATYTLESGTFTKGAKVRGTIKFQNVLTQEDKRYEYSGEGSFVAEVCDDKPGDSPYPATPTEADKGPVKVQLGAQTFVTKSAIARLSSEGAGADAHDVIKTIQLFSGAGVDCSSRSAQSGISAFINGPDGAASRNPIVGSPQPRQLYIIPGETQAELNGSSWAKLDRFELKDGGTISGSVYGETSPDRAKSDPKLVAKIDGTFTALVCRY